MEEYKTCGKCKQIHETVNFYSNKSRKDGLTSYCKPCHKLAAKIAFDKKPDQKLEATKRWKQKNKPRTRAYQRIRYAANPAKYHAFHKKWAKKNPVAVASYQHTRRLRIQARSYKISKKDARNLMNKPCFYCKQFPGNELDHVIPVSRGGNHSIGNLVPACSRCNRSKGAKFITEWRLSQSYNNLKMSLTSVRPSP